MATLYGLRLVYAAGPAYLFMCALLYAPGIIFYTWAWAEAGKRIFKPWELMLAPALVAVAILAA